MNLLNTTSRGARFARILLRAPFAAASLGAFFATSSITAATPKGVTVAEQPIQVEVVNEAPVVVEMANETPMIVEVVNEAPVVVEVVNETPIVVEIVNDVPVPVETVDDALREPYIVGHSKNVEFESDIAVVSFSIPAGGRLVVETLTIRVKVAPGQGFTLTMFPGNAGPIPHSPQFAIPFREVLADYIY
jgi:hypothetical protein